MQITFSEKLTKFTEKDKTTYSSSIIDFLTYHLYHKDYAMYTKMNEWSIHIADVSESDAAAYSSLTNEPLNFSIPHGITIASSKEVKCYVSNGSGDMFIRQNFVTISHELCHMLLFMFYGTKRMKLRVADKNMKAGSDVALATGEVHNRKTEERLWTFKIGGRRIYKWYITGLPVKVIDIRDLTDERNIDRIQ